MTEAEFFTDAPPQPEQLEDEFGRSRGLRRSRRRWPPHHGGGRYARPSFPFPPLGTAAWASTQSAEPLMAGDDGPGATDGQQEFETGAAVGRCPACGHRPQHRHCGCAACRRRHEMRAVAEFEDETGMSHRFRTPPWPDEAEFAMEVRGETSPSGSAQTSTFALVRAIPDDPDYRKHVPLNYRLDAKQIVGEVAQDLSSRGKSAHIWVELAPLGPGGRRDFCRGRRSRYWRPAAGVGGARPRVGRALSGSRRKDCGGLVG